MYVIFDIQISYLNFRYLIYLCTMLNIKADFTNYKMSPREENLRGMLKNIIFFKLSSNAACSIRQAEDLVSQNEMKC